MHGRTKTQRGKDVGAALAGGKGKARTPPRAGFAAVGECADLQDGPLGSPRSSVAGSAGETMRSGWRRVSATAVLGLGLAFCAGWLATGAIAVGASPAMAVGTSRAVVKRHTQTISVLPARTTTVNVAYPDALEFGGATYSGEVRLIGPNPAVGGRRPKLSLIKVLSRQSAEGGSVLRVRIRNANPLGTLAARAVVSAITRLPVAG
jgi:hypothetical protein